MFVVFDLDGTLANCEARVVKYIHCPRRGPKHKREVIDWDAFFKDCFSDEPIKHALATMAALIGDGHRVEVWTGRSDLVRRDTEQWLAIHSGAYPKEVRMRQHGDHTDDHELKAQWIERYGRPDLVFEDRGRVVDMWRSKGVPCYQVEKADF